ncbi:DUF5753 domain-containing protein [Streptomyces sp. JV176]|uniref:DUF5753 domain-containing protein n=1 Tax=Streptomyces sp. JV176 TaxID=858630 RepID=UPI002E7A9586|nr:DUF5753 domain-containing protein [Streptomyces sp. JV176]MEE1799965.1 DUF5753 domain-containing protein [Streptomyces sp. JV176]
MRRIASHCSATDRHLVDALADMAEERGKGWWEKYKAILPPGFLDQAELEHHAVYMRAIQMLYVPGLFQTEAYARELITSGVSNLEPAEVNARVEHRMRRREIFERLHPPKTEAFIHEAAPRMRYGPTEVMREQLAFLHEVSRWPSVTVGVVPFEARITGSVHSILYAGAAIPQLDTVQLDSAFDGGYLDAEAQLTKYRSLLDSVEAISLGCDESGTFIQHIAQGM